MDPNQPAPQQAQQNQGDPALILQAQIAHLQNQLTAQQDHLNQQDAQLQAVQGPHIKPNCPKPYSGKKTKSFETWIFQVEQFLTLSNVPLQNHIQITASFLEDKAGNWWRSYYRSKDWTNAPPTWAEFLTAACKNFIPVDNLVGAYDCLQCLSQRTSVATYNHEFQALMLELPDMDYATCMNYYEKGLKDHICPFVVMQCPTTLEDAESITACIDATSYKSPS